MSNQHNSTDYLIDNPHPLPFPRKRDEGVGGTPALLSRECQRADGTGAGTEGAGDYSQLCHMTTLLRQHLPDLAQSYHIKALGIFGSYVRNEQTLESDLDILIDFEDITQQSLLTVARLENTLSDVLGVQVDLTLYQSLKPTIGKAILKEVVWL